MERISLLVAVVLSLALPAAAQDKQFDAAEALYAAYELSEGGRPLYRALFQHGWPTDRAHTAMTREIAAETSDLLVAVYLGSRAGLPLSASNYQMARKERLEKSGIKVGNVADMLAGEIKLYRALSGYRPSIRQFQPIFLPFRRSKADLESNWDPEDLGTWRWKTPTEQSYSLQGLGFGLLAECAFARQQLLQKRTVDQQGRKVTLIGRTPRDGFFALVALHSAAAKVYALKHRLLLDFEQRSLTPKSSLAGVDVRRVAFPTAWTAEVKGATATYQLAKGDNNLKSRLGAQAAVLLGAAELAAICGDRSPDVRALFTTRLIDKRKVTLFEPSLRKEAITVALYAFRSMAKLHVSVRGSGKASSLADRYNKGGTITPVDLGLYLMSLRAFLTKVKVGPKVRGMQELSSQLKLEHDRARTLVSSLSGMIRTWQQDQPGFYDVYSVRTSGRQSKTKSLASQAFAIRGLLATHRALKADPDSPHLAAAKAAVQWLDAKRWDPKAKAYVEKGSKGNKAPLFGAVAVLAALREMALETGDGRYLARYQQYFESLRARGFIREAASRIAPGLRAEVDF